MKIFATSSKWVIFISIFQFLIISSFFAQGQTPENPFFRELNKPVNFQKVTAENIKEASDRIVSDSKKALQKIYNVKPKARTFNNTMLAIDNLYNEFSRVSSPVYLLGNVHADSLIRTESLNNIAVLSKFGNEISLDEKLYKAVKEYSETKEAKSLTGEKKKFLAETLRDFERNGFALSKEKRDELETIQNRISDIGIEFNKNISADQNYLILSEKHLSGLPDDYKNPRKQDDGTYKITMAYPDYMPFMKYSESDSARKELYKKYNTRAADKNLEVLQNLLKARKEMATLLGYKSFAAYQVETRMAKKPETIWAFEDNLVEKVKQKAKKDYDELLDVKKTHINDAKVKVIQPWEASFYNNLLLVNKYQLDDAKLKEYFELNNVLDGLFQITQHLFDLQYEKVSNSQAWHEDVSLYEVKQNGKLIGRFYLDLHPRPNKYNHAACFTLVQGKLSEKEYQLPTASLVCNFPRPEKDKPALMPHSEVITFFHEFGHVLHNLLTTAELSSFSGTSVARDFVEAPSQIFENWAWNYDALKLFSKHYKTGEVLPKEMFNKMLAARNVGTGLAASQQIFYGMLDMTLHDRYDPTGDVPTTAIVKELQNKVTLYPYLEGTNMQAAFGHLDGYGAGYYGYLWSKVYAEDMFSVFEKNGVMDQKTGKKYRDEVLARGGTDDELQLVKNFLEREPNEKAFLKSLGL
ncbi:MAG: Zn-dependent oligopeptidase [Bacteroidota bacterium]|nr:Zn-dependent oligopeptidase [Bacteroidota bacterium]